MRITSETTETTKGSRFADKPDFKVHFHILAAIML